MLPDEIYANSESSSHFKYSHPLSHAPVDDGSMRARLAYDLMTFMKRSECSYFMAPDAFAASDVDQNQDEIDIMIVDGFYKEAEILIEHQLRANPECEKALFQRAFVQNLKQEYGRLLEKEETILKHDPKNVNALLNKGFALANLNREEEALAIADLALRIDPDNLNILGNKAYIAKLLGRDELRQKTLVHAYNVSAKKRIEALEEQEARLLQDFDSAFLQSEIPSAFEEFNLHSGIDQSDMLH
ncbi:MAG: hypothetical protein COA45_07915 [Zetaproteobacteria bacterium]|nr:MAG: hypothetical protein COA45_07915 [Zetaproteobacteria bacterium]